MERFDLRRAGLALVAVLVVATGLNTGLMGASGPIDQICVVVHGLGGMPEYEENFVEWAARTEKIFGVQEGREVIRLDGRTQRRDEILKIIGEAVDRLSPEGELWWILVGHANHNGTEYKFNIRGPDLTDGDIGEVFTKLGERKAYLIAATSASGALLPALSGPNRVVVTATRNKFERQPPLFYSFFLEAAASPDADANKNGKVSILEAYLFSQQKVGAWFEEKGRLQTEHSRLDDQGSFALEAGKDDEPQDTARLATGSGLLSAAAHLAAPSEQAYRNAEARDLAAQRVLVEREIEDLKFRKGELDSAAYYKQLEALLVKLAELSQRIESLEGAS